MHLVVIFIISVALVIAVVTDLRARRIPNWLSMPLMLSGISEQIWLKGWEGGVGSIEGMALIVLLYSIPFVAGGMGAGDIKLLAAIAAWVGPHQALVAFVAAGIAGGFLAIGWVAMKGALLETVLNVGRILCFLRRPGPKDQSDAARHAFLQRHMMPYSPAIAIGTAVSFLHVHL